MNVLRWSGVQEGRALHFLSFCRFWIEVIFEVPFALQVKVNSKLPCPKVLDSTEGRCDARGRYVLFLHSVLSTWQEYGENVVESPKNC